MSNAKGVGAGVLKYRMDSGPGYRIDFGRDGETVIVFLGGGTKRRQQADIETGEAPLAGVPAQAAGGLRRWH